MDVGVTCSTCRFWEIGEGVDAPSFDDRPRGLCRRRAPQPRSDFDRIVADYLAAMARRLSQSEDDEAFTIHESEAAAESYWPVTVGDDWCGEYVAQ